MCGFNLPGVGTIRIRIIEFLDIINSDFGTGDDDLEETVSVSVTTFGYETKAIHLE